MSIEDLKIRTDYLIEGLKNNKFELDDIVVDAFSIAREILFREYGMLAYEVQMMGAYVVHCGDFAEMYTGEGKSLTILLVAFLNALEKKGVHIVTVNEYLVERDAKFAEKAFEKLGITVGFNTSKLNKSVKKEMYDKDITYTTNSELGFDYLKDNMVRSMDEKVIRQLHFVIIDEADSVLIDEARTPLIISGQPKEDLSLYVEIDNFVSSLKKEDYVIDNESNTISLSDSGVTKAEKFFRIKRLFSVESAEIVHKITNALMAHYIFSNGKEYLVKDDKIHLVDQFTGRVLEGRSYNAGLQQAIQAKEKVKIDPENVVMATITYQSFFRLYDKLSGVSGTAMTEAEEFLRIYNMVVVRIPTNKPIIRIDKQDYIFGTKKVKWNHVIAEIVERHKTGQPILVGTASVSDSELIHERLKELGIPHEVLNARDNSKEAEIVKHGGERGAITISTNMAGRGTDIKVPEEMKAIGGLYVIGTERHESRRIDNQLRGRTGRQGDPGESRFFTSLEDSLFKRFATDKFTKASEKLEEEFYDSKFFSRMLDNTQKKVEGLNFDIRKNLMDYDHVLSLQRELIYKQRDQILLKTSNFEIVNNMLEDYVSFNAPNFKNRENSALVDSRKISNFLNEEILKFDYFKKTDFENQAILVAIDKLRFIIREVINVKYSILKEISALDTIDEILLSNLDKYWTIHIDKMTKLREGVNLRSLEQRSPLNIYIEDGNNLFEKMKSEIVDSVITQICELSLPNEMEKITIALDNLVKSEEFLKIDAENIHDFTDYDSSKVTEDENMFVESNKQHSNLTEDEKDLMEETKIIDTQNIDVDEVKDSSEEKVEEEKEEEISSDDVFSISDEWVTSNEIFEEGAEKTLNQKKEEEELKRKQDELEKIEKTQSLNEDDKDKNDENLKIENEHPKEDKVEEKIINDIPKPDLEIKVETREENDEPQEDESSKFKIESNYTPEERVDLDAKQITEDKIDEILNMDIFNDPNQKSVSLSDFLNDILDNMFENEPNKNKEDTENIEKIRDEVKKEILNELKDEKYLKYKRGFFQEEKNDINYQPYLKSYQELMKKKKLLNDDKDEIKSFYKQPNVEKRKTGTLFGRPLNKYDRKIDSSLSFDEYIKMKEKNAASPEEINNLLFVDDEKNRLKKINDRLTKNKETKYIKEREEEIKQEPKIEKDDSLDSIVKPITLEKSVIPESDVTLLHEEPQVISSGLIHSNDGVPYDEEEHRVIQEIENIENIHKENLDLIKKIEEKAKSNIEKLKFGRSKDKLKKSLALKDNKEKESNDKTSNRIKLDNFQKENNSIDSKQKDKIEINLEKENSNVDSAKK